MALIAAFIDILQNNTFGNVILELLTWMTPIWVAVLVGVLVGWAWKPKWANMDSLYPTTKKRELNKSAGAFSHFTASLPALSSLKLQIPTSISWTPDCRVEKDNSSVVSVSNFDNSLSRLENKKSSSVNEDDLVHLHKLVEEKDGGNAWIQVMDRSLSNMSYQAWRRDPETGPPQYRSRTVYEDISPEMVRDFFWDDEFRLKWDDMCIHAKTLEECPTTGEMVVHLVRKFPFFCSDREYIIGRRIWDSRRAYYCITKGVPCSCVPRRDKPRRVDLFYSSWCIRAAESKRDGRLSACEVVLFHHEDMGIPREIAKLGIRQGMWGAVKKIDRGLRAYQKHMASGAALSRSAFMARVNTRISCEYLENTSNSPPTPEDDVQNSLDKRPGKGFPKMVVIGGAIALAFTLDRGLVTKAVLFGIARRFANMGRRL